MEDRDLILVSMVKQHPHIYDRSSVSFKDKTVVENSWRAIAMTLKTTADDCQRRWYVLRNRYAKEKREGDIPDPTRKQWPLMHHLSFLENHVKRRRSFRAMGVNELNYRNDHKLIDDPIPTKSGKWEEIILDTHRNDLSDKYLHSDQSNTSSFYGDEEDDIIHIKSPPIGIKNVHSSSETLTLGNIKSVVSSMSDSGYTEDSLSNQKNLNSIHKDGNSVAITTSEITLNNSNTNVSSNSNNDSNMHFCLSLHAPLQKIPKHLLTRAKIEILQVLDKYENSK